MFVKYQKQMGVCGQSGPNFISFIWNSCSMWGTAWSVLGVLDSFNPSKNFNRQMLLLAFAHVNSRCKWDSGLWKMPSFKIGAYFTGRDHDVKRVQGALEISWGWFQTLQQSEYCNKLNIATK